jgi:hypothetical protein
MRRRAWARMRERRAQLLYIWPERPGTLAASGAQLSRRGHGRRSRPGAVTAPKT